MEYLIRDCITCCIEKLLSDFPKNRRSCKKCIGYVSKMKRQKDPEKYRQKDKESNQRRKQEGYKSSKKYMKN
jgi:hypothetical protein